MGKMGIFIQSFGRKTWRERPLGRPRRRRENNRMDLMETRWEGVDWIHLAQDRVQWRALVNTVMDLRAPYKAGNFLTSWVII